MTAVCTETANSSRTLSHAPQQLRSCMHVLRTWRFVASWAALKESFGCSCRISAARLAPAAPAAVADSLTMPASPAAAAARFRWYMCGLGDSCRCCCGNCCWLTSTHADAEPGVVSTCRGDFGETAAVRYDSGPCCCAVAVFVAGMGPAVVTTAPWLLKDTTGCTSAPWESLGDWSRSCFRQDWSLKKPDFLVGDKWRVSSRPGLAEAAIMLAIIHTPSARYTLLPVAANRAGLPVHGTWLLWNSDDQSKSRDQQHFASLVMWHRTQQQTGRSPATQKQRTSTRFSVLYRKQSSMRT